MILHPLGLDQIPKIQALAEKIWPPVFMDILKEEQIDYMMEMMYSQASLENQINHLNHQFFLLRDKGMDLGYTSCEFHYMGNKETKIHKLYLDSCCRGKGYGVQVISEIGKLGIRERDQALILNVNRNNPAVQFYLKTGFAFYKEEKIDIGNGYYMDDWVMKKIL
jgi:GNAT superfamily N-acetyltransferase